MIGKRVLAGTSGAKFGNLRFATSGLPNFRTTTVAAIETPCLPNIRATSESCLPNSWTTRSAHSEPACLPCVGTTTPVTLGTICLPGTSETSCLPSIGATTLSWRTSRRGFASYSAVLDYGEVPTPKGLPVIGTTLSLILAGGPKKLHKYIDRRHTELGSIFKDNVGPVTAVFVSEPEEMRKVFANEGKYPVHIKPEAWLVYNKKHDCTRGLFFMDGEDWLTYRRKMNRLLLKGDLTWIEECCEASNDVFLEQIARTSGQEFGDLERRLYKWSTDTVLAVLMGAESYRTNYKKIENLATILADDVKQVFETTCKLQLIPATLAEKSNISRWKTFERTVTRALNTANQTLDFLDKYVEKDEGLLVKMREEGIEDDKMRTIVVDLMLGAGDTTSNTMVWALYLLGRNTEMQDSLRKDLGDSMLRNTVKETLRLYPAAPFLTRVLPDAIAVGGYQIPRHTLIVMSIYTSGRDKRFFTDPEEFMPARWCRDYSAATPLQQNASLPFGIGARSCVGRKIAEAQLQGALGRILREYKIQLCDEKQIEDVLEMITKPERPVKLTFNKI